MICPYCSTEIEPLDLAGKLFCSNCGMTISNAQNTAPSVEMHKISKNPDPTFSDQGATIQSTPIPEAPKQTISNLTNQINKTMVDDLGLDVANELKPETVASVNKEAASVTTATQTLKPETTAQNVIEPVIPKLPSEPGFYTAPPVKKDMVPKEDEPKEPTIEALAENETKPAPAAQPKNIGILMNILEPEKPISEITDSEPAQPPMPEPEIRVLNSEADLKIKEDSLTQSVKNIDALGASGILLDILNDEAVQKERSDQSEALNAAQNLVDLVKPIETPAEVTKPIASKAPIMTQKKPKETPAKQELPDEESGDKSQDPVLTALDHQTLEPVGSKKLKVNILDGKPANPIERPEIVALDELDLPTPEETKAEDLLNEAKQELAKDKVPEIEQEVIVAAEEPKNTEAVSTANDTEPESPTTEQISQKQEHLKNYFSQIISDEKKKPTKKKGKKKTKAKPSWKIFLTVLLVILAFAGLGGGGYYYYASYYNKKVTPAPNQNKNVVAEVNIPKPKEIPYGYELTEPITKDDKLDIYTGVYSFTADRNRTLTYEVTKSADTKAELTSFIKSHAGTYKTETDNQIEYTIYTDGTVAWIKDDFLYTITTAGDTFNEQVLKMAKSVE